MGGVPFLPRRLNRRASYNPGTRPPEARVQRTTGVGAALRKARVSRGISIDEASRDTRIHGDILEGLESETFARLENQVHIRGSLRTYAGYLGLPAEAIVERYRRASSEEEEAPSVPTLEEIEPVLRGRDHRLVGMAAVAVLIAAAAFGVLSSRSGAPAPADLSGGAPSAAVEDGGLLLAVTAAEAVEVSVRSDALPEERFTLQEGESRSFEADSRLAIWVAEGTAVTVSVNGVDQAAPGLRDGSWRHVYTPDDPALIPPPSPSVDTSGSPAGETSGSPSPLSSPEA